MPDDFWTLYDLPDPFNLRSDMERFFREFSRWKKPSAMFVRAWEPKCDIYESEEGLHVIVDLAGVDEEDVELVVQGRMLTLRGRRDQKRPAGMSNTHLLEIDYGDFRRDFQLPTDVDCEAARAVYRKGLLEIFLPKASLDEEMEAAGTEGEEQGR